MTCPLFQTGASSPRAIIILAIFALLKTSLFSQETADYRGVWAAKTPDGGELILIVKTQQPRILLLGK